MKAAALLLEEVWVPEESPWFDATPCNNIHACIIPELKPLGLHFKVNMTLRGRNRNTSVATMVDCGATALFISERFVKKHKICTHLLDYEIPLYNIDSSKNRAGKISQSVRLQLLIGDSKSWSNFLITDLGPEDVMLGLPWLRSVNPNINWAEGTMEVKREKNRVRVKQVAANRMQRRQWWRKGMLDNPSETLWCVAEFTYLTELAERASEQKHK
jgi:hypothetical protein